MMTHVHGLKDLISLGQCHQIQCRPHQSPSLFFSFFFFRSGKYDPRIHVELQGTKQTLTETPPPSALPASSIGDHAFDQVPILTLLQHSPY